MKARFLEMSQDARDSYVRCTFGLDRGALNRLVSAPNDFAVLTQGAGPSLKLTLLHGEELLPVADPIAVYSSVDGWCELSMPRGV